MHLNSLLLHQRFQHAFLLRGFINQIGKFFTNRISKDSMSNYAIVKERRLTNSFSTINHLCWQNKVEWPNLFLQRADSRECKYNFSSQRFQCCDVGTERQL